MKIIKRLKRELKSKNYKNIFYYTIKIVIGVYLSLTLARLLNVTNPVTAAIITILSVKETRRKSIDVSVRRFIAGNVAILLSFAIYSIIGFRVEGLVVLLLFLIPLTYLMNAQGSIISGFVLSFHILSFETINLSIYFEENIILLIGILTGFFLIIHMPNTEKKLIRLKNEIEEDFKTILLDMSYNLRNLCYFKDEVDLSAIEEKVKTAKKLSYRHRDNLIVDQEWYYIDYFQMRLLQLYRLIYMKNQFQGIFITQQQAGPLSQLTYDIGSIIGTEPDTKDILKDIYDLKKHYKAEPLPKSRLEFEDRSRLFNFLNDLEEFILIKRRYLENNF